MLGARAESGADSIRHCAPDPASFASESISYNLQRNVRRLAVSVPAPVSNTEAQTSMDRNEQRPTSRLSRRRWIAVSLLVAISIIIGFWLRRVRHPIGAAVAVPNVRAAEDVRTEAPPLLKAPTIPGRPQAASTAAALDLCGIGKVPLDASDPSAVGDYLATLTSKVRARWLFNLLDSDDARARAAGLLLQDKLTDSGDVQPIAEQKRDAMVQLAVATRDPAIYAMAIYGCHTYSDPAPIGSCQQISLNSWALMDADNAVPWLLLAGKAHAGKDAETESTALVRAAGAHKSDAYNFSLYSFSESALPNDATPLERSVLATELMGIESATGSLHYGSASKLCSADAMQDTDVRQRCDALAELLVSKGTTVLDLSFGTRLGARAGWSTTRVAALTEERDALMGGIAQATASAHDGMWSCDAVRRGNAYLSQRARLGELGAARDALERSGETVPDLAQKQRDFIDTMLGVAQRQAAEPPPQPPP
jgi:hypothetical protein